MNLPKQIKLFLSGLFVFMTAYGIAAQKIQQGSGLATGQPGMNIYPTDQPGETTLLERPYSIAPPMVPHDVTGLEISRFSNDCLGCHLEGVEVSEGHVATKVPTSHFSNEYTGEEKEGMIVGIRYNCLQCHVPQSID
ncbi:MAG: nitrate reductase cytochrome c-type subunit [Candidatus Glassbacteria bacterium]